MDDVEGLIEHLRWLLGSGASNTEVKNYLLDVVGLDPAVQRLSEPTMDLELVDTLVRSLSIENARPAVMVFRVRGTEFRHGLIYTPDGLGSFFYFADTGQGFAVLLDHNGQDTVRFGIGTRPRPPGRMPGSHRH